MQNTKELITKQAPYEAWNQFSNEASRKTSTPNTMDEFSVWKLMRPLQVCLRFYGIYLEDRKLSVLKIVHAAVSCVLTAFMFGVLYWLYNTTRKQSWEISPIVTMFTAILLMFVTYVVMMVNRKRLIRTLNMLDEIQRVAMGDDPVAAAQDPTFTSYRRYAGYLINLSLLWAGVLIVFKAATSYQSLAPYFDQLAMNGSRIDEKLGDKQLFEAALAVAIGFYTVIMMVSFAVYVSICIILWMCINKIDDVCKARGIVAPGFVTEVKPTTSMTPVEFHHLVSTGVDLANDVFTQYMFICSSCELTVIMFITRNMNLHLSSPTVTWVTLMEFWNALILFATKNLCAGNLNLRIVTSLKKLYEIHDYRDEKMYHNAAARNIKIKLYVQHNLMKPPAMTGWNLYTPSRSTVFTAATNILTYVLVLYRLTEEEQGNALTSNDTATSSWANGSAIDGYDWTTGYTDPPSSFAVN